jgi:hypothetical protein
MQLAHLLQQVWKFWGLTARFYTRSICICPENSREIDFLVAAPNLQYQRNSSSICKLAIMNNTPETARLQAKKKQLKVLMAIMLIFMVAGPLLGPKLFAQEFSQLTGAGLYVFYIGTPTIFGALFLFDLFLYRRTDKKIREEK